MIAAQSTATRSDRLIGRGTMTETIRKPATLAEPGIHGREPEVARIDALIARARTESASLVILGDAGLGKSALAAVAAERGRNAGHRTLTATGLRTESTLPYAGLHQLLRPLVDRIGSLPPRQRAALEAAFGMSDEVASDRYLVGLATLTLLADASEEGPILILVDDAQTIDEGSIDAFAFAVRRLQAEPIGVLVTSRYDSILIDFPGSSLVRLGSLDVAASRRLLGEVAPRMAPDPRARVLEVAAGNPLAILELAAALDRDGHDDAFLGDPAMPLPVTERLERVFADRFRAFPDPMRGMLIVASASDNYDIRPVLRAGRSLGFDPAGFRLADEAGLVFVHGDEFRCRHPIVRSLVYRSARPEERRAAHRALADALADEPDRRAWHLAAASFGPDEDVAVLMEQAADRAKARGDHGAASRGFERSAAMSPDPHEQARRLSAAIELASLHGEPVRIEELHERIRSAARDPRVVQRSRLLVAYARSVSGRGLASEAVPTAELPGLVRDNPRVAAAMLALAAGIGFSTGDAALRGTVTQLIRSMGPITQQWSVYALAATEPAAHARELDGPLRRLTGLIDDETPLETLRGIGLAHWHLDRMIEAEGILRRVVDRMRARSEANHLPLVLMLLGFVELWRGRPAAADGLADEASRLARDVGQPLMHAMASALSALVAAQQGRVEDCEARAAEATSAAPEAVVLGLAAWARGVAALGEGRSAEALARLQPIFEPGRPATHFQVARWAIGDLVEASMRAGGPSGLGDLVAEQERLAILSASSRSVLIATRARALLEPGAAADGLFRAARATDGAGDWPFEHARTSLLHGEWLRRRRRIVEARPLLDGARQTFERLGSRPWAERARVELRAAGVTPAPSSTSGIDDLTPQQLQIAQMAAQGLSNREIGERLFLSPRTVGYHLYNAYPKLRVTSRSQLAGALAGEA